MNLIILTFFFGLLLLLTDFYEQLEHLWNEKFANQFKHDAQHILSYTSVYFLWTDKEIHVFYNFTLNFYKSGADCLAFSKVHQNFLVFSLKTYKSQKRWKSPGWKSNYFLTDLIKSCCWRLHLALLQRPRSYDQD